MARQAPPSRSKAGPREGLNARAEMLLKALVERYIRDGRPVGSRTLARDAGLNVSPATVRNVMSDLEEMGFIRAPHTSAGRIPTPRGYRFFVDALLEVEPLQSAELDRLRRHFEDPEKNLQTLLQSASAVLSGITRMAGVVSLPRREQVPLRQIELLPLAEDRILAVLVISEREVENKIVPTDRPFGASELQQMANYLNAHIAGKDLMAVRARVLAELRDTRQSMDQMMREAVAMAEKLFAAPETREDFILAGEFNLMEFEELSDVDKLRRLFEAFNHKREVLRLLDECIRADGVQIFIGEEAGYQAFDECSVITAPYGSDGEVAGVLGVIGPTRMAYDRVIPVVDVTARLLGAALNARA